MARIISVEPFVKEVLESNPAAREDDFILINDVLKYYVPTHLPLERILTHHVDYCIPSFASIIRIRRKLQLENINLESEKAKRIRAAEEQEYREQFARHD